MSKKKKSVLLIESESDNSDSEKDLEEVSFCASGCDYSPHRATPDRTGPHRAGNDRLFHFDDELKGVRRANYLQMTKEMNPSRRS